MTEIQSSDIPERQWLTTDEAADYLRLSPGSLRTFRSIGKGPRYHKAGRAVRYRRDQLDSYLNGEAQ